MVRKRGRYALIHNDTDSIVQQALAKNDSVQLRVDPVLVENREDGNGIRG